ncbi:MAG: hypothetical protein KGI97_06230, partial [Alphaproteobacteria bacterium]|nr:hypothetical protein [Alphaproteobacteria bacterium]
MPAYTGDSMATLFSGLLIGVVVAAAAYLFFIWIVIRDRGQVFLLLFLLCLGVNIAGSSDLLMGNIGLHDTGLRDFIATSSLILSWVFGLFFSYYFLELDTNNPAYTLPFMAIAGFLLVTLVYSLIDRASVALVLPLLGAATVSAILISGLSGVRNGTGGSLVHIVAFTCFLIGALARSAYVLGYIASPANAYNATYIAYAMSALLFAIVVANQFAARQDEKEKALAISNERFALATRGANEGLFDWNLATGEIFFSDQFRRILGIRIGNDPDG